MTDLLSLFASDLAQVRFGDLDRATLEAAAQAVHAAAEAVAEAEQAAATARETLARAHGELLSKGQRALAHARIHAEGMPELAQRIQSISLDSGGVTTGATLPAMPGRRRGRPPKRTSDGSGTLLLEPPSAGDAAAPPD